MRAVPLSRRSHCRIPCRVAVVAEEAEGARQAPGVLQEVVAYRAQTPRSQWEHEGGYCDEIAEAMADVLNEAGIEAVTRESSHGVEHTFVVAEDEEGRAVVVDVPYRVYEIWHGAYSFELIPGAQIRPGNVVIERLGLPFSDFLED